MARARRSRFRWLALAGGCALLVALFWQIGPRRIVTLLATLGANFVVIVAIFSCHECVRAVALGQCIGPRHRLAYRHLLRIRFLGEAAGALTRTGPLAGEPMRAFALARRAERAAHAVGASASELIANSLISGMVTIAVTATGLWMGGFHGPLRVVTSVLFWGSFGFCTLAITALASRTYLIGRVINVVGTLPWIGSRLVISPDQIRQMEDGIMQALTRRGRPVVTIALLELLAQFILVFEVYWSLRSMGLLISPRTALVLEVLIKAPNIIQFIGATEGGFALIFDWAGLTAAAGFTLSLVRLLRSLTASGLWLAILPQVDEPWTADTPASNGAPL